VTRAQVIEFLETNGNVGVARVINRGNYRRPIFGTEGAARLFSTCRDEACTRYG